MNTKLIKNMKNKKKKKGFTLIELIIVIAILAILAALALPKFGAVKDTANKSADLATAKNIESTIAKLVAEDKILLPTTSTDATGAVLKTGTGDAKLIADAIDGDLTAKFKTNKGKSFTYTLSKDGEVTVYITGVSTDILFPSGAGNYAS